MSRSNKLAVHLLLMCMVRKSDLLEARWENIDLENKEWHLFNNNTAKKRGMIVYLPSQAIGLFSELKQLACNSAYVLPSVHTHKKHIAANTLNIAVEKLNLKIPDFVLHDFRRTASTILHEMFPLYSDVIEKSLLHEQGGVRGIYNKAQYKVQRIELLQAWANLLESLMLDDKVVFGNFKKTA